MIRTRLASVALVAGLGLVAGCSTDFSLRNLFSHHNGAGAGCCSTGDCPCDGGLPADGFPVQDGPMLTPPVTPVPVVPGTAGIPQAGPPPRVFPTPATPTPYSPPVSYRTSSSR
jgi:hypothetical protein